MWTFFVLCHANIFTILKSFYAYGAARISSWWCHVVHILAVVRIIGFVRFYIIVGIPPQRWRFRNSETTGCGSSNVPMVLAINIFLIQCKNDACFDESSTTIWFYLQFRLNIVFTHSPVFLKSLLRILCVLVESYFLPNLLGFVTPDRLIRW